MGKLFEAIRARNAKAFIGQCSFLLENRMRCPKGADWVQVDNATDPPTETQYCRYHAVVLAQTEPELLHDAVAKIQTEPEPNKIIKPEEVKTNVNTTNTESKPK